MTQTDSDGENGGNNDGSKGGIMMVRVKMVNNDNIYDRSNYSTILISQHGLMLTMMKMLVTMMV